MLERGVLGAGRIDKRHRVEFHAAGAPRRQDRRHSRGVDRRLGLEEFHQALGRAGRALQVGQHFRYRGDRARRDRAVEDERREIARREAAVEHIVPALPQDHADSAEDDQHDQSDQQGGLADAPHRHFIRGFNVGGEIAPRRVLVHVGLHGAHLVQRLVDEGAHVGNAVLARARGPPHPPADHRDGQHDQRRKHKHDERELEIGDEQHAKRAHEEQHVAQRKRKSVADDRLEQGRVVGQAGDHFACPDGFEIARGEPQDVVEHRAADIRDHALAGAEHQEEARVRRKRKQRGQTEHCDQRTIEHFGTGRGKAGVDHIAQALAEREHARGSDQQGAHRARDAQPVGREEPRQADELREVPAARTVGQAIVED